MSGGTRTLFLRRKLLWLFVIASAITFVVVAQKTTRANYRGDSFDSSFAGWSASKGKLSLDGSIKRQGTASLRWTFDFIHEAVFLLTRPKRGSLSGAESLTFWARSDLAAPMFLRVDLADKAAFVAPFEVKNDWQQTTVRFDEMKPAGKARDLEAAEIIAIYFVDLNGKDRGLNGERSLWLDELSFEFRSPVSDSTAPPAAQDALLVKGFDAQGHLLSVEDWRKQGTSAGVYLFGSDLEGNSVDAKLRSQAVNGVKIPSLAVSTKRALAINALFWNVPGYGKVRLQADNAGAGYRAGGELILNYELARSRFDRLLRRAEASHQTERALSGVSAARSLVEAATREKDDVARAAASDRALQAILIASDDLELQIARAEIDRLRKGHLTVRVTSRNGSPVRAATVDFQEVRSDTLFGCIQSFGFTDKKTDTVPFDQVSKLMQDAGFNHYPLSLFWDRIEPSAGSMALDAWDRKLGVDSFFRRGFTFSAHAMVQSALPDFVKKQGGAQFGTTSARHVSEVMRHYMQKFPNRVIVWEAINEPSSNRYTNLEMQPKLEAIREIVDVIQKTDPGAETLINEYDWDRGQRHTANFLQTDLKEMISSLDLFHSLGRAGIHDYSPGLEWYPGLRVLYGGGVIDLSEPLSDFAATGEVWDRYNSLGKPLHLSEMAVPGTNRDGWTNGYWHRPWDATTQAEYMGDLYTLAFSKPYIHEITYWGITDDEPWAIEGGLLNRNYEPKPVYSTLKRLLTSWTTHESLKTGIDGTVSVHGFAGQYLIEVRHGDMKQTVRAHLEPGKTQSVVVSIGG